MRDFRAEAEAILAEHGGLFTFDDILDSIHHGRMQSFAEGNTLAVTQINDYPRKTVVEIVLVVGEFSALPVLEQRIAEFAQEVGAEMLMASARKGFDKTKTEGWKSTTVNYLRQL